MKTKEKPEIIRFDSKTRKWFESHPDVQTTVAPCEECGLWYKPILGHKCKNAGHRAPSNVCVIDGAFFGNYSLADEHSLSEVAGHVTISSNNNVKYHIDPIEDSVSIMFRRIDALDAFISDLMRLRERMANLKGV